MHEKTVKLENFAKQVRRDIVRMVHAVQSGHPGGSLGCADFITCLYQDIMNHNAANFSMDGAGEDLFFLSNGHISPVFYSVLARSGYFPVEELKTFRKINTRLQGHPTTHEGLPGVRIASGSLGQGMSVAIGAALAKKMNGDDSLVYCLHGDGELQEGQIWEATMYAAGNKVDNLIATVDYNHKQIDGDIADVLPLVLSVMANAKNETKKGKPVMVIMKTEMGQGVDFMMGTHKWHGSPPSDEQLAKALAQIPETLGDY